MSTKACAIWGDCHNPHLCRAMGMCCDNPAAEPPAAFRHPPTPVRGPDPIDHAAPRNTDRTSRR